MIGESPVIGSPVATFTTTAAFAVFSISVTIDFAEIHVSAVAVSRFAISAVTLVPDQSVYLNSRVVFVAYAAVQ